MFDFESTRSFHHFLQISDLEELSRRCHKKSVEEKMQKLLEKSKDIEPIAQLLKQHKKQLVSAS